MEYKNEYFPCMLMHIEVDYAAINLQSMGRVKRSQMHFAVGAGLLIEGAKDQVQVYIKTVIGNNLPTPAAEIDVRYAFRISHLDSYLEHNALPEEIKSHLISVAFGTTRGVVHCHLQGTPLSDWVLPMTKPYDIIVEELDADPYG